MSHSLIRTSPLWSRETDENRKKPVIGGSPAREAAAGGRRFDEQPLRLERSLADDQHARCAIADLAGIGRADLAALLDQPHTTDALDRGIEPQPFLDDVAFFVSVDIAHREGQDIAIEGARADRGSALLVARQREPVELVPAEPSFVRDHLRTEELAEGLDAEACLHLLAPRPLAQPRVIASVTGLNMGARLAAITMSCVPDNIAWAANWIACCDDPHRRSIVTAGTDCGNRDESTAL
jgi:hypothetical protein